MKTSRERLLDFLYAHHPLTSPEISRALRMTEANARHHLGILKNHGLVQVSGTRPAIGKGRPLLLYSPSDRALGDNLCNLADALLTELLGELPEAEKHKMLQRIARRMPIQIPPGDEQPARLTQRLFRAVQQLNAWSYQARWEAHTEGPRLVLGYCPYAAILPQHPELCKLDALVLERLLDKPVTHIARLTHPPDGGPYCVFRLHG